MRQTLTSVDMCQIEEILALDLLTLREHTEQAGDAFDAGAQRLAIERHLVASQVAMVRRAGRLVAYAMLQRQEGGRWFVTGFNTHPAHRAAPIFRELFAQILALAERCEIASLQSHVYKTNRRSIAFHQRLGFHVTRENAKAVLISDKPQQAHRLSQWGLRMVSPPQEVSHDDEPSAVSSWTFDG